MTHLLLHKTPNSVSSEPGAAQDALSGAEPITHSACYILKLHGDYKDTRILNTDSELEKYPPQYDALLDRIFDEYGLIVCGWSGEWDQALRAALLRAPNRRYPLYWAVRGKPGQSAQKLADHRRARVIAIANADEFFVGLRERVESLSLSQRQNPISIELLVSTAKRYLGKPEYRIQLHDLFEQETKNLLQRTDSDEFVPSAPWAIETFRNRRDQYEAITEPMARLAGVAGRWGDDNELEIVLDVVRSLQQDAGKQSAGLNHYVNLRLYAAVLVFTAYGLGLTRSERWPVLHQLFSVDIDLQHRESKRAIEVFFPHCWEGGGKDLWNQIDKKNLKTPLSDHLCSIFTEWGSSFAALTPDFQLLFERFEILGALAYLEASTREEIEKTLSNSQDFLWIPIGRSLWHERNAEKILTEIQKEPAKSDLAKAGFANGNSDMLNLYATNFKRMSGRLRWM